MGYRTATLALLAVTAALLAPLETEAQFRRGRESAEAPRWAPITIGAHAGYDQSSQGELLGLNAHVPILRSGRVELVPSAEMTFLDGAKDYQYSVDAVVLIGDQSGGVYLGGGWGIRDTVINTTVDEFSRETLSAPSLVAGARTGSGGPVQIMLQVRWIHVADVTFRPAPVTGGIAIPLW